MNLLEALRYLVALARHRHFGRAAQACGITQPALSNAIRALESHLGVAIVRRSRQFEGLTPEGELVLAHAHRLLHEAEAMHQTLAGRLALPQGRLQVGAVPTAMPIAARFVARLRTAWPGVQPVLYSLSSPEIEIGLDSLALDIGLGYSDRAVTEGRRLQVLAQYSERYFLVRRQPQLTAPFRFAAPMRWAQAATLPLALLTPDMHNRAIVDAAFREAGAAPRDPIETNSMLGLVVMVQEGGTAAILPGALVGSIAAQGGLQAQPLTAPLLDTPIGWLSRPDVRPTPVTAAALAMAAGDDWLAHARAHSGALKSGPGTGIGDSSVES